MTHTHILFIPLQSSPASNTHSLLTQRWVNCSGFSRGTLKKQQTLNDTGCILVFPSQSSPASWTRYLQVTFSPILRVFSRGTLTLTHNKHGMIHTCILLSPPPSQSSPASCPRRAEPFTTPTPWTPPGGITSARGRPSCTRWPSGWTRKASLSWAGVGRRRLRGANRRWGPSRCSQPTPWPTWSRRRWTRTGSTSSWVSLPATHSAGVESWWRRRSGEREERERERELELKNFILQGL